MSNPYVPGKSLNQFVTNFPPVVFPMHDLTGNGSPEGAISANPGTAYIDLLTGTLWLKATGVQTLGWKDMGLSSTVVGAQQVFSGNGSPEGVVTPTGDEAFYVQKDSVPAGLIWSWYDSAWH